MRRPTSKELFELAAMWLFILITRWYSISRSGPGPMDLLWLCLGGMWIYRYCSAEGYAKFKAEQARQTARLQKRFGRRYKLVSCLPYLLLLATLLLALLLHSLTLFFISFAVFIISLVWLVYIVKTDPD